MAERWEAVVRVRRDRLQPLLLDAGRLLMLCGAVATISTMAGPAANSKQAFIGLLIWQLGVCLLALVPAAGRFPQAALVGAAMASAVIKHCFTPWN